MKTILKVSMTIVLVAILGIAALTTYIVVKEHLRSSEDNIGAHFTLGEDGATKYIPEKKIEETAIEEQFIFEGSPVWT